MVPRLLSNKRKIGSIITTAKQGDTSGVPLFKLSSFLYWKSLFYSLWYSYIDGFFRDEMLLSATLLDDRNVFGRELEVPLLKRAKRSVMDRLKESMSLWTFLLLLPSRPEILATTYYQCLPLELLR